MIKPALTAEQWDELGNVGMVSFPNGVVLAPDRYKSGIPRHAEAALALHGQPFGFTREDVEMLQLTAERANTRGNHAKADALLDLSERIEALLPPEKK